MPYNETYRLFMSRYTGDVRDFRIRRIRVQAWLFLIILGNAFSFLNARNLVWPCVTIIAAIVISTILYGIEESGRAIHICADLYGGFFFGYLAVVCSGNTYRLGAVVYTGNMPLLLLAIFGVVAGSVFCWLCCTGLVKRNLLKKSPKGLAGLSELKRIGLLTFFGLAMFGICRTFWPLLKMYWPYGMLLVSTAASSASSYFFFCVWLRINAEKRGYI